MRVGRRGAQEEALRQALMERNRRQRRRLLAIGLGALASGLGVGFWAGLSIGSGDLGARRRRNLDYAHRLARGPLPELLDHYAFVLDLIDLTGGDEILWRGVRRMTRHALSTSAATDRLARELARTISYASAPADLRRNLPRLRARGGLEHERR